MDKCAVFVAYFRGSKPLKYATKTALLECYCRGEENFAGGKFREIPFAVDIIFAARKFRAKSQFANIAKISSTRKIGVIQYFDDVTHPNWIPLYSVFDLVAFNR